MNNYFANLLWKYTILFIINYILHFYQLKVYHKITMENMHSCSFCFKIFLNSVLNPRRVKCSNHETNASSFPKVRLKRIWKS